MPLHQCDCVNEGTPKPCAYPNSCNNESEEDLADDTAIDTEDDVEILGEKIKGEWIPLTSSSELTQQSKAPEKEAIRHDDSIKSEIMASVEEVDVHQASLDSLKRLNEKLRMLCEMVERRAAPKATSGALSDDDEVEILSEKNSIRPSSTPQKGIRKSLKLACNTPSSDNDIEILSEKTNAGQATSFPQVNPVDQINADEGKPVESKGSLEPAHDEELEIKVVPSSDKKLEPSRDAKQSLWERIQEFKAVSKQFSAGKSIAKPKKQRKLSSSSEDQGISRLVARMEMMRLNQEFTKALNNYLYSENFFPYETEDFIVKAREVILSRWWSMNCKGIHVIIFSEGFTDQIHPCYWGNVLDEDLLESLHVQTGRVNQTLFAVEKGIRGENVVKLSELSEGEIDKGKIGSQCVANFQHRKIFAKIYKYSGTMQLIQEGHGKRMTCYYDQVTLAHSHKKEVWCRKYDL